MAELNKKKQIKNYEFELYFITIYSKVCPIFIIITHLARRITFLQVAKLLQSQGRYRKLRNYPQFAITIHTSQHDFQTPLKSKSLKNNLSIYLLTFALYNIV